MQLTAKERLVLALDVDDFKKAEELVGKLSDYVGVFKVGSQLFTAEGAKVVKAAGLDGVVASSWESKEIRKACGEDFVILTPGIRPAGKSSDDQKRIMTPREAMKLGADFLVIGRPIRNAANPVEAAKEILKEMEEN